jgi:glucose-1-phosphate thymidylyltransferase
MKGVLLAGGLGSRLMPCTKVTNKHLLPIFNKPMIYYPLNTLIKSGIKDILLVTGPDHAGHFIDLLGDGSEFKATIQYEVQTRPLGIAHALGLAGNFAGNESVSVILGDNIFGQTFDFSDFKKGARIHLAPAQKPENYGVPVFEGEKLTKIIEKPTTPPSKYAVTGIYLYDNDVFKIIDSLKPSPRGELEITDVNNHYLTNGLLDYRILTGFWNDAGTFENLHQASKKIRENENRLS